MLLLTDFGFVPAHKNSQSVVCSKLAFRRGVEK